MFEAMIVIEGRKGPQGSMDLEFLLHSVRAEVVPFDAVQAELASSAWRRFGKGQHPASLNLADCCSYALAKLRGEALLAKGNDFAQTDIEMVSVG